MNEFGKDYAKQLIKNSKVLGKALYDSGFKALCPEKGFTQSHQVIVNVKEFGGGKSVAQLLEDNNIICNKMSLPNDTPQDATKNPSGIRLGSQEMTRIGMKEGEMKQVAEFFKKAIEERRILRRMSKSLERTSRRFIIALSNPVVEACLSIEIRLVRANRRVNSSQSSLTTLQHLRSRCPIRSMPTFVLSASSFRCSSMLFL